MWQIKIGVIETQSYRRQLLDNGPRQQSDIILLWLRHLYKPVLDTVYAMNTRSLEKSIDQMVEVWV